MISLDEDGNLLISQENAYSSNDLFVQVGFVTTNQTGLVDERSAFIPIKVKISASCQPETIQISKESLEIKVIRNSNTQEVDVT